MTDYLHTLNKQNLNKKMRYLLMLLFSCLIVTIGKSQTGDLELKNEIDTITVEFTVESYDIVDCPRQRTINPITGESEVSIISTLAICYDNKTKEYSRKFDTKGYKEWLLFVNESNNEFPIKKKVTIQKTSYR